MLELLAPAGNLEKLNTAFYYGADACYFAGKRYGLRAFAGNFKDDELEESVKFAHSLGKKAYITLNIIAHNPDFEGLKEYVLFLESIHVDAVIVADVGIIAVIREVAPNLPVHVSTQANITNKYSAKFFADMGVTRLILARELSLPEIKEIREFIPKEIELETFVHGAMCISYSGRCLLSNYLTGRDSNRGACAQVCRWEFSITEKNRKGEQYDIVEDDRGTYILNSKDLNMIEHLHELVKVGVTSFKIEGRMKSPYYVANVVNAYRRALNYLQTLENVNDYKLNEALVKELEKSSHRNYTTGFYFGDNNKENLETSNPIQNSEFLAIVKKELGSNEYVIEQRNKFLLGDMVEILSPTDSFNKTFKVEKLRDLEHNVVSVANQVQQELIITCPHKLQVGDILRTTES
jgi:putative protease